MWYYLNISSKIWNTKMDKKYALRDKSNISIKLTIIACYLVRIESNAMTVQKTRSMLCEIYIIKSICAVYISLMKTKLFHSFYYHSSSYFLALNILSFSNLFSSLLHDQIQFGIYFHSVL